MPLLRTRKGAKEDSPPQTSDNPKQPASRKSKKSAVSKDGKKAQRSHGVGAMKESKPMDFDFERKSHQMFKKFLEDANNKGSLVDEDDGSPFTKLQAFAVTKPLQLRKSKSAEMPMESDYKQDHKRATKGKTRTSKKPIPPPAEEELTEIPSAVEEHPTEDPALDGEDATEVEENPQQKHPRKRKEEKLTTTTVTLPRAEGQTKPADANGLGQISHPRQQQEMQQPKRAIPWQSSRTQATQQTPQPQHLHHHHRNGVPHQAFQDNFMRRVNHHGGAAVGDYRRHYPMTMATWPSETRQFNALSRLQMSRPIRSQRRSRGEVSVAAGAGTFILFVFIAFVSVWLFAVERASSKTGQYYGDAELQWQWPPGSTTAYPEEGQSARPSSEASAPPTTAEGEAAIIGSNSFFGIW